MNREPIKTIEDVKRIKKDADISMNTVSKAINKGEETRSVSLLGLMNFCQRTIELCDMILKKEKK